MVRLTGVNVLGRQHGAIEAGSTRTGRWLRARRLHIAASIAAAFAQGDDMRTLRQSSEPEAAEASATAEAEEALKPRKKTRRGSRGGKNRRNKTASTSENGAEAAAETEAAPEAEASSSENGDFEYVPMSEWADDLESR